MLAGRAIRVVVGDRVVMGAKGEQLDQETDSTNSIVAIRWTDVPDLTLLVLSSSDRMLVDFW